MFNILKSEQWMIVGVAFIAGMIGAVLIQLIFVKERSVAVATINITGMVQSYIKDTGSQNITAQEKQERIKQFANLLNQSIEKLSHDKHVILLPSEAVIAGANDLTQQTKEMIKKRLAT